MMYTDTRRSKARGGRSAVPRRGRGSPAALISGPRGGSRWARPTSGATTVSFVPKVFDAKRRAVGSHPRFQVRRPRKTVPSRTARTADGSRDAATSNYEVRTAATHNRRLAGLRSGSESNAGFRRARERDAVGRYQESGRRRMDPAGFEPEPIHSLRSWQGPNPEAMLVTAHCRSQNEWALPDSNQRPLGVPFPGGQNAPGVRLGNMSRAL